MDIGTSSTKGVLVNKDGLVICQSKIKHTVDYKTADQAEQHPNKIWWNETFNIIRDLIKKSNISTRNIKGIGCSGMFPVLLPIDKHGRPLREAILYNIDTRSRNQINYIQAKINKSGMPRDAKNNLTYQAMLPKIKWVKDNEPHIWSETQTIFE